MQTLAGYDEFVCTADRCPDDCCHGWSITVDEAAWSKYQSSPAFRDAGFLERIEVVDLDGKPLRRLKLDETNHCFFLKDGLCSLYLTMGEEFQTEVCRRHPRAVYSFCGETHRALKPDCPAVAEALLCQSEPLTLLSGPEASPAPLQSHSGFDGLRDDVTRVVRDFIVSLLQARETSLYDRLFVLGSFCAWVQDMQKGGDANDVIKAQCDSVREALAQRTHRAFSFPHDEETLSLRRTIPLTFLQVLRAVVSRPDIFPQDWDDTVLTAEYTAETLEAAYQQVLLPYYRTHEHCFENFLVAQIYASAFPFPFASLTEACHTLMLQYALFQLWLVTLYHDKPVLSDGDFVRGAYYFSKCVGHDENGRKYLMENAQFLNLGQLLNWLSYCS